MLGPQHSMSQDCFCSKHGICYFLEINPKIAIDPKIKSNFIRILWLSVRFIRVFLLLMWGQEGGRRRVLMCLGNANRGSKEVFDGGKYLALKSSKRKGRTNIAKRVLKMP